MNTFKCQKEGGNSSTESHHPTENIWQEVMNYMCGKDLAWKGWERVMRHRKWFLLDQTQILNLLENKRIVATLLYFHGQHSDPNQGSNIKIQRVFWNLLSSPRLLTVMFKQCKTTVVHKRCQNTREGASAGLRSPGWEKSSKSLARVRSLG